MKIGGTLQPSTVKSDLHVFDVQSALQESGCSVESPADSYYSFCGRNTHLKFQLEEICVGYSVKAVLNKLNKLLFLKFSAAAEIL